MLFFDEHTPTQRLKIFNNLFIRAFRGPYAIQRPEQEWRLVHKNLSDRCIQGHLGKKYWLGTRGPWYVMVVILDFDGWGNIATVQDFLTDLGIKDGSYLLISSPSYKKDGSCHALIPVLDNEGVPTIAKAHKAFSVAVQGRCEIYPHLNKIIRTPFGKDQRILNKHGLPLDMPWWEAMGWVLQLEPVELSDLPRVQRDLPFKVPPRQNFRFKRLPEAEFLWKHGLQAKGTRYDAQFLVAQCLYRQNLTREDVRQSIKRWIRKKHNGFSEKVNAGDWKQIDREIDKQTAEVWRYCADHYPDGVHNLTTGITKTDLEWAAQVYPWDPINQRRLVHLVAYVRPRAYHEWVYIPYSIWDDQIVHWSNCHPFITDLEERRLLRSTRAYRRGEYCYKFQLELPKTTEDPIALDDRNADDFWDALLWGYNGDRRVIREVTGIPRDTVHRQIQKRLVIPELEKSLIF